ncbi:MAG: formimidoylglutamase [Eudoraea sp.]|nr:formimidoylglutamase [Eudoraea sp.]
MKYYHPPKPEIWKGRSSKTAQYLHEQVIFQDLEAVKIQYDKGFALLGYACDEGVRRNQGRVGAKEGPDAIKQELAKLPCPLSWDSTLVDVGAVSCPDQDLESAQAALSEKVKVLLDKGFFPLLLGGGHDIAYGHYSGIREHLGPDAEIGIINFDAHFDLRNNSGGNNSGTPFYQIARKQKERNRPFHYLCLGIREEANSGELFNTAREFDIDWVTNDTFNLQHTEFLRDQIRDFLEKVDRVYLTIDLDGFSSAYAPGVSAASPFGFTPEIALWTLQIIIASGKLISMDLAEMNPVYDQDRKTAKLAAGILHHVLRHPQLL